MYMKFKSAVFRAKGTRLTSTTLSDKRASVEYIKVIKPHPAHAGKRTAWPNQGRQRGESGAPNAGPSLHFYFI